MKRKNITMYCISQTKITLSKMSKLKIQTKIGFLNMKKKIVKGFDMMDKSFLRKLGSSLRINVFNYKSQLIELRYEYSRLFELSDFVHDFGP